MLRKIIFILGIAILKLSASAQTVSSKDSSVLVWHTDLVKANELSKTSGKALFVLFTGSDWCPWCKKLQKDVFQKPAFIEWAQRNVVLVEIDFPRNKILPAELQKQNQSLQQTFQVSGFPTVWLFYLHESKEANSYTIERLGSLGYPQHAEIGKEEWKFLKEAEVLLKKNSPQLR